LSSYFKESLSLDNIHKGCRLVEIVLKYIDPSLYNKLKNKMKITSCIRGRSPLLTIKKFQLVSQVKPRS